MRVGPSEEVSSGETPASGETAAGIGPENARRTDKGFEPERVLTQSGFGGGGAGAPLALAAVRGGVPGGVVGAPARVAHDAVLGSNKRKGIWWMPWH